MLRIVKLHPKNEEGSLEDSKEDSHGHIEVRIKLREEFDQISILSDEVYLKCRKPKRRLRILGSKMSKSEIILKPFSSSITFIEEELRKSFSMIIEGNEAI